MMKKLLPATVLALSLAAAATTFAGPMGDKCGRGGDRGMPLLMLDKVVDLTDVQKQALEDIRADMKPMDRPARGAGRGMPISQLDATAPDYDLQVEALADAAAERARQRVLNRAEMHAKVQAILTEEQRAELEAFRQEMREQKKGQFKHGGWE